MSSALPSDRPRLVLVTGIYPPDIGGPATHIADLETSLRENGFKVLVLTLADVSGIEELDGVVRIPRAWPWPLRLGCVALWLVRNASRYEVIYATGLQSAATTGGRLAGRRVVVKVVGDPAWERGQREGLTSDDFHPFQSTAGGPLRLRAMRRLRDWWLRSSDEILAPSAFLASTVEAWLGGPAGVKVVPNGVRLPPGIERSSSDDGSLHVVWVGRLVAHKRVERIVEAVSRTRNVNLSVVGEGPESEAIEGLVKKLGVADRVHLSGVLSHERSLQTIADSDALVLASDYEGLPHVAIEALAVGTPIVSPNVGGTAEVLHDGETGLLVADASVEGFERAFARLRDDEDLRSRLRAGASAAGNRWTFSRTVAQIDALLIGPRRPRVVFIGKTQLRERSPDLHARLTLMSEGIDARLVNVGRSSVRHLGRTVGYVLPSFRPPIASGAVFYAFGPVVAIALATRRQRSAVVCQSPYEGVGCVALAQLLPDRWRPAVVVEVHGDWRTATRLYGSRARRLLSPIADRAASWALRRADRVRVVGTYTEGLVREVGFKGIVDSFIAFNDISTFMGPVTDPPAEPVVMFVGVLEPYKGVDVLLHAWADVVKQVPHAQLRLIGEGNLRANLVRLTQELSVSASVEFLGRIPREQMPSMFDSARMLVLPSRSEGLGLVVIEAMARGRPVVATAVGGIVELVHKGVGRLVAPDDPTSLGEAISSLLMHPEEGQSLGLAGRNEVTSMSESGSFGAGIDRLRSWAQGE